MRKMLAVATAVALTLGLAACGSDSEDNAVSAEQEVVDTTSVPADVRWEPVGGIAAPVESADGPSKNDPVRAGYQHTPQGAVVAAINGQVALATADDQRWPDVLRELAAPGQGRDQWAQGRVLLSIAPGSQVAEPAKFEGFRIASYTPEGALVLLAVTYPEVGLTVYPVQMNWQNDDWKLVLPSQDEAPDLAPLDSLDAFTEFSAN